MLERPRHRLGRRARHDAGARALRLVGASSTQAWAAQTRQRVVRDDLVGRDAGGPQDERGDEARPVFATHAMNDDAAGGVRDRRERLRDALRRFSRIRMYTQAQ